MSKEMLIIGVGGHAVRIDPATGAEVWRTKIKGGDFVTIHEVGSQVFAGAGGVLFCLEAFTGKLLWKNNLKGLGTGIISFMSSENAVAAAAKKAHDAAMAAGAAAAAGS